MILEIVPLLETNNWSNPLASTVVILKLTLTAPPPVSYTHLTLPTTPYV